MRVGYRELASNRRFGVELEMSNTCSKRKIGAFLKEFEKTVGNGRDIKVTAGSRGWAETRQNDYWHVKYDATCGPYGKNMDHGWEVASYIGRGHAEINLIAAAAGWLAQHGLEVNRNCGLHIHVDARDLTTSQVGLLMARWIKIEPYLQRICASRRSDSVYCKSLTHRYLFKSATYHQDKMDHFYESMAPTNTQIHGNSEKKYALNFVGYTLGKLWGEIGYDKPTIELRLPECLLNHEHVLNWTRLFLNFVDSCVVYPAPGPSQIFYETQEVSEVMSYLGLQDKEGFWILDDQLLDTKKWFLKKLVESPQVSLRTVCQAEKLLDFISEI